MKRILTITLVAFLALFPAFAAEWRTESDGTYTFGEAPPKTDRFATTGIISPVIQPASGYILSGELYLPSATDKSRKTLAFLLGTDAISGDVGAEMVLVQAGRPPLLVAGPYAGPDTLRDNYVVKKHPDWLLLIGADALCIVGAVVMARWGNIWGPAPKSWGGGDVNYLLGYGGAGFFIVAGLGVTLWQLLAPTGKVEAIGYPFPETGVKAPADKWADFSIRADADSVQLYLDGELALEQANPGPGLAIHSIEGMQARLRGLEVE
ncbi:MAG: hypothetical protein GY771_03930 [bacterium]|nr:hypothetical protein [bacterium]